MHANLIVPATRPDCDAGFIIMEPTEYPAMSGSNTICVATVLLETGMVEMREPETTLRLEAPAGVVEVRAACRDGQVRERRADERAVLRRPARRAARGRRARDARPSTSRSAACGTRSPTPRALGFALEPSEARELSRVGELIRVAAREQLPCVHPENPEIAGVSIVQIAEPWRGRGGGDAERGRRRARAGSTVPRPARASPPGWRRCTRAG